MARPTGVEPVTSRLGISRSILLSYGRSQGLVSCLVTRNNEWGNGAAIRSYWDRWRCGSTRCGIWQGGVFTRDMMLVVSVDLAAMLSLINVT